MNITRAWILALLMAGACLPAWAQRKIVETAPGTVKAGPTNVLRPDLPAENRGGGLFDRLYKPNSIQLAPMETAPSSGSATSSKLDPVLQKRMLDEQAKRKNWAIENAARMNRGDSMIERRRSDSESRRSGVSGREPTAAELNLQAVDPKYARQFKENNGNPTEVGLERARMRAADQQRQKRDGRKSGETDASDDRHRTESEDPNEPPSALDSRSGSAKSERELDRWDKLNSNPNDLGKIESPLDRAAARLSAADTFDTSGKTGSGDLDLADSQRQERLAELSSILGEPTAGTSDGLRSEKADSFSAPTRSDRASEFQRLLAPESAPTPAPTLAPRTGGDTALSGSGDLSRSAGTPTIQRDLPGLSAPTPGFNFNPAASTPALAPATPRMTPRPIQLPVPVRGKGGF